MDRITAWTFSLIRPSVLKTDGGGAAIQGADLAINSN